MNQIAYILRSIILIAICTAIAYSAGDAAGIQSIDNLKSNGGVVMAKDIQDFQRLGASLSIIAFFLSTIAAVVFAPQNNKK